MNDLLSNFLLDVLLQGRLIVSSLGSFSCKGLKRGGLSLKRWLGSFVRHRRRNGLAERLEELLNVAIDGFDALFGLNVTNYDSGRKYTVLSFKVVVCVLVLLS